MTGYLARLRDATAAGYLPAGQVTQIDVEHGPGCDHHRNRASPCTCFPRITAIVGDQVLVIGSHGAILERSALV